MDDYSILKPYAEFYQCVGISVDISTIKRDLNKSEMFIL